MHLMAHKNCLKLSKIQLQNIYQLAAKRLVRRKQNKRKCAKRVLIEHIKFWTEHQICHYSLMTQMNSLFIY